MDIERLQRRDIDNVTDDRLTLSIDELKDVSSPYVHSEIKGIGGNNWIIEDDEYVKYNLIENDKLILEYGAITDLSQKDISKITVSFDYEVTNYGMLPLLGNVSIIHDSIEYKNADLPLNASGHIDMDCQLFGIDNEVLNTIISSKGFSIGLTFNGNKSNATLRLSNVNLGVSFSNKLQEEMDAVRNRLYNDFDEKQDKLVSGANIKTINDMSLLGSGNILIGGGGSGVDIATTWGAPTSDSKVPSEKLTKATLDGKLNINHSAYKGKNVVVHPTSGNIAFEDKPTIPEDVSELSDTQNTQFTPKAHAHGNILNGGTITSTTNNTDYIVVTDGDMIKRSSNVDTSLLYDTENTENSSSTLTNIFRTRSGDNPKQDKINEAIDHELGTKQDALISGINIKTINNVSLLGSGNISVGSGGTIDIATSWNNPTSNTRVPSEKLTKDSLDAKANSIHTHTASQVSGIADMIYPVGSIYMSVNSTSPATLFGGTWERIKDTFLLAAGDTYEAGGTGGEAEHTLTVNEMPTHSHTYMHYQSNGSVTEYSPSWTSQKSAAKSTSQAGGGQAHNNMPPYLAVYIWRRIE